MKRITLIVCKFLFSAYILLGQSVQAKEKIVLGEDENIKLILHYKTVLSIADSNWLNLEFLNKSDSIIFLDEANYHFDVKNENRMVRGLLGNGDKFKLICSFFDLEDYGKAQQTKVPINRLESIHSWRYLTNYSSSQIEKYPQLNDTLTLAFGIQVKYELEGELRILECNSESFNSRWISTAEVPEHKLITRLRNAISETPNCSFNKDIISTLIRKPQIIKEITDDELIEGILLRGYDHITESSFLLFELMNRGGSSEPRLLSFFREKIKQKEHKITVLMQYFWDDSLMDDLFNAGFVNWKVYKILELNSKYWSQKKENRQRVYDFLEGKVGFDKNIPINHKDIRNWSHQMKTLAISRNSEFIRYLKGLLDDESECLLQDWSKFKNKNRDTFKPEIKVVRVCDIAFVAMLRALNQIQFEIDWGSKYLNRAVKFGEEIIDRQFFGKIENNLRKFDVGMYLYECYFKLSPEAKDMIKKN